MMGTGLRLVVVFVMVAVCASPAAAQDERRWGLLFAYPGSVGVQWDASDKFALRLDADYVQTTFTSEISLGLVGSSIRTTRTTTTTLGITRLGISTPFTVHSRDSLKLYVAPRVAISIERSSSTSEEDGMPADSDDETETQYDQEYGGVFGALYRLGDRFGVFGETGFQVSRFTSTSSRGLLSTQTTFGLRAGVGGILYF